MPSPNGCLGDCCAAFFYPTHKDELKSAVPRTRDEQTIKGMLIPLTIREMQARRKKFGVEGNLADKDTSGHWYKCRHWDENTRLCTIYTQRPQMCRDYPYAGKCEYGCSHRPTPNVIQRYINDAVAAKSRPR